MISENIASWFDEVEEKGMQKGIEKGKAEKEQEMLGQERYVFKNMIK